MILDAHAVHSPIACDRTPLRLSPRLHNKKGLSRSHADGVRPRHAITAVLRRLDEHPQQEKPVLRRQSVRVLWGVRRGWPLPATRTPRRMPRFAYFFLDSGSSLTRPAASWTCVNKWNMNSASTAFERIILTVSSIVNCFG